ncbi:hypothetical protein L1987_66707 [Smallanthus sonchifolius]|uniref:Uncharacterized protein n=1 Tax=Smallanthus sonchifolius TaxID=185202 RepID=A0ACB9BY70_9ASTR|nr:hypothetical protein L1987_66707 [Smallanthus sonchifolius]
METKKKKGLVIEDYPIEGLSIAGHETCIILPTLNLAFDIGKCPQRAISQQFLFISHGLPMYVATRGLYRMSPPTIIVPKVIKENVEKIFEAHRAMDQSDLKHTLIGLDYVKQKLKPEYVGLPGDEIKKLKFSGVEITYTTTSPEVAFTGDTTSDFIVDANNADMLKAKVLIMEIVNYASKFENKAIVFIHFSARYQLDVSFVHLLESIIISIFMGFELAISVLHYQVIQEAISALGPPLAGRVFALTEGF